ncbi:SAM-dependent methyltransferase [Cohnella fermenti]|uniref:Tetratricopeptide repeat protein n=1 Tax=Cohnella fermenti TaxID=2565925 RepID=A0A4S4BWP3_9BACL|nr:SAM-dependent methyltransferase [Cohnella fermenti]THF79596.1 tetratricopeptide repeat protein [Cohnella fermenti]
MNTQEPAKPQQTDTTGRSTYRFSEAPIWELQRQYYEKFGLDAWRNDQVPQYITSNPMIGTAYADILFGMLQDLAARGRTDEPVVVVELGAGAGRFAGQVLHSLGELIAYAGEDIKLPPYRYIMTDLAADNVAGWQRHPVLAPHVAAGRLDFARFDVVRDTELRLAVSGETIRPGELNQPLLIIANYLFDSLPQELLYIGEGQIYECDVEIEAPDADGALSSADALAAIRMSYVNRRAPEYDRPDYPYRGVIDLYRQELEDSHVLFPEEALRCLERLHALSSAGFVLITADKGDHLTDDWRFAEPPNLVLHGGSFSLTANYHAINRAYEERGALALFPEHHYKNLNVGCLLMLENPGGFVNAKLAYRRSVERFGPDDFFSLKLWMDRSLEFLGMQQVLAFWRLGRYDAEWFIQSAKRISELLPEASDEEKLDIELGIRRMWAAYYEMPQRYDLALDVGMLLFEMDRMGDARLFLERSVAEAQEEPDPMVYYCLAICCLEQEEEERAASYLRLALKQEPDHPEANELLDALTNKEE